MDIIIAIVFSYFYSIFYYAIPINLIPAIILYSIKKRTLFKTLILSLIVGIISEIPYPQKIWLSPIFYIILTYFINFLKQEFLLLIFVFIFWFISFEIFKLMLDFKTNYLILTLRIGLTTIAFLLTWQYLKNY
ncbi:MAG: hypothetical protein ABIL49_01810 [candidate division WOR-3 bacterium]